MEWAFGSVGLALEFFGIGMHIVRPKISKSWGYGAIAAGFIFLGVAAKGFWPDGAEQPPSLNGTCVNVGPSQGPQTNNCPTIVNPPAPRAENVLYQDGRPIADVAGAIVDEAAKTVRASVRYRAKDLMAE